MNLSNSGLSLDSINIELKEYEFSIQQLKTFDKSINDFYNKYYNKYITLKSYKQYIKYAEIEAKKITNQDNSQFYGKFYLDLTYKRHDSGIRYSYKTYVKHDDSTNTEKKPNVEIKAYVKDLGNWEEAQYEILKLKPSFGTSLTFLDTLYELTNPNFYNTQIHGDSAISFEQFRDIKVDLGGNKLIKSYIGSFAKRSRELPSYEKTWVNGVVNQMVFLNIKMGL